MFRLNDHYSGLEELKHVILIFFTLYERKRKKKNVIFNFNIYYLYIFFLSIGYIGLIHSVH